jgi:hypothetical protein
MTFDTAEDYEPGYRLEGWWFGAHDERRNANIGKIFADSFAKQIDTLPEIDLYPRADLRFYLDAQRMRLEELYPNLTDEQREDLFARIDPLTIARDRECDTLIVGTINDCYLVHNRTIHWWQSVIRGEIRVFDVRSGELIWEDYFRDRDNFDSPLLMVEEWSKRLTKRIRKNKVLR